MSRLRVQLRLETARVHDITACQDFFRTLLWVDWLGFHPVGVTERRQVRARGGTAEARELGFDGVGKTQVDGEKEKAMNQPLEGAGRQVW